MPYRIGETVVVTRDQLLELAKTHENRRNIQSNYAELRLFW